MSRKKLRHRWTSPILRGSAVLNEAASDMPAAWSRLRQDVGIVLWCSFLAACVTTMLFFALFDPMLLMLDDAPPRWLADRRTAYTLGFFFFWMTTTLGVTLAVWLIDTRTDARNRP